MIEVVIMVGVVIAVIYGYALSQRNDPKRNEKDLRFFFFPEEGRIYPVVRGEKLERFIMVYRNHTILRPGDPKTPGQKDWDVVEKVDGHKNQGGNLLDNFLYSLFGIRFIGLFTKIPAREFKWTEFSDVKGTYDIQERKFFTNFMFAKRFPYAFSLEAAETMGKLPVDVKITVYVTTSNPAVAIYQNEDWFNQLAGYVLSAGRDYVGSKEYEKLVEDQNKNGFADKIISLNDTIPGEKDGEVQGVIKKLGICIEGAKVEKLDLSKEVGDRARAAAQELYVAKQEGDAAIMKAELQAKATVAEAEGIAKAIEIKALAGKKQAQEEYEAIAKAKGTSIRLMELIRDSKIRVYAPGSKGSVLLNDDGTDEDDKKKGKS